MFLRSAKNAGFNVESDRINRAMQFVVACYDHRTHIFRYQRNSDVHVNQCSRTVMGILALAYSGMFDTRIAQ